MFPPARHFINYIFDWPGTVKVWNDLHFHGCEIPRFIHRRMAIMQFFWRWPWQHINSWWIHYRFERIMKKYREGKLSPERKKAIDETREILRQLDEYT